MRIHKSKINKLIKHGLKIGKNVTIYPEAIIDSTSPYLISIGDNCTISTGVRIFSHDGTTSKYNGGYEKLDRVVIKENCFIGVNAVILPGVIIGPNVSIAIGSLVNKNIPPNSCVAGVPARIYGKFDEMIEKHKEIINSGKIFSYNNLKLPLSNSIIQNIKKETEKGALFVNVTNRINPFTFN